MQGTTRERVCHRQAERHGHQHEAWERLFVDHRDDIRRSVVNGFRSLGWTPRPDEVDDAEQDVYCRLLETRAGQAMRWVDADGAPRLRYVRQVARNVAADALRRRAAYKRGAGRIVALRPCHDRGDSSLRADERLIRRETGARLRERLRTVVSRPQEQRALRMLELSAVSGLTCREIAETLPEPATASSVSTAMHRLRRRLASVGREALLGGEA